jgi:hypothetical protein
VPVLEQKHLSAVLSDTLTTADHLVLPAAGHLLSWQHHMTTRFTADPLGLSYSATLAMSALDTNHSAHSRPLGCPALGHSARCWARGHSAHCRHATASSSAHIHIVGYQATGRCRQLVHIAADSFVRASTLDHLVICQPTSRHRPLVSLGR